MLISQADIECVAMFFRGWPSRGTTLVGTDRELWGFVGHDKGYRLAYRDDVGRVEAVKGWLPDRLNLIRRMVKSCS